MWIEEKQTAPTRAHTCTHPHTPHTYPLMPADTLNLINRMKLHVNGKMAEREKEIYEWAKYKKG